MKQVCWQIENIVFHCFSFDVFFPNATLIHLKDNYTWIEVLVNKANIGQ